MQILFLLVLSIVVQTNSTDLSNFIPINSTLSFPHSKIPPLRLLFAPPKVECTDKYHDMWKIHEVQLQTQYKYPSSNSFKNVYIHIKDE